MHWGDHGAVLRRNLVACVDTHLIRCTKEEAYTSRLAQLARNGSELADIALATHSFKYIALPRRFESLYLLVNVDY